MKKPELTYIKIGKIGSTYGVHGWLKIRSYTEFGPSILEYQPWYLTSDQGHRQVVTIEDGRVYGKGLIIKIPGIDTPEAARLLTGYTIEIDRALLPSLPKNEYYWSDLEGLTVIDTHGKILGTIKFLMETGSNDVMVVKGEKEHAIPYLPHVVVQIDLDKKEMIVDWELI